MHADNCLWDFIGIYLPQFVSGGWCVCIFFATLVATSGRYVYKKHRNASLRPDVQQNNMKKLFLFE